MSDPLGSIDEDAPPEPVIPLDPELEELWSSRALLLVLLLLILSFWVSYYLKVRRIKSVHETLVALFAGGFIGLIVRLSPGTVVQNMISFKNTILLNVLLPPIILNSGFELRQANFFRNFGVILAFAFAGTFISAVVLGVLVYIWALLGLEGLSLGIIECLIFGSTLSATDPVTVLAIFNTLKVDPTLYSIIFGESLLNDAVAIVMFETLSQFHGEHISIFSFFHGVGIFLLIFLTSMALGVVFGLACSLMLKHSRLNEYPELESCLVILIAYTSYFFSNGLTMSGIVSLLFCGITLKHYAYHNMSKRAQRTSKYMFATLAQLCENFIFIYLGLSLFTQTDLVYKPLFILVTTIAACAARWMAVFPISKLINIGFRARGQRSEELPQSYQMMLFWAGLRGAVGVALAAGIKGHNAKSLRTTVLVTVVISLVFFGGTIGRMVEITGIRTGVHEEEEGDESSDEEGPLNINGGYRPTASGDGPYRDGPFRNDSSMSLHGPNGKRFNNFRSGAPDESDDDDNEVLPSASSATFHDTSAHGNKDGVWRDGQWFNALDEQYLLPVFSNATASRRQATRKAMRSTARLTQHGNDSFIDDNEPERDLTSLSREGSRSPWDTTPTSDGRQGPSSAGGASGGGLASSSGRDSAGPSGQGRNSRGSVDEHSHRPAPSLSAAVSSLFSSMSPVSSSSAQHHDIAGDEASSGGNGSSNATILPLSSSSRYLHDNDHVQEVIVPDGSLSYTTSTPPMPSVSLAAFRMPKRRNSDDDNVKQSVPASSATSTSRVRGASSSSSPSGAGPSPKIKQDHLRFTSNPAATIVAREDALQRRLSAPMNRNAASEGDEMGNTASRGDRSQSSTGHY